MELQLIVVQLYAMKQVWNDSYMSTMNRCITNQEPFYSSFEGE